MEKIRIDAGEVLEFKRKQMVLYASQTIPKGGNSDLRVLIRFFVGFPQFYQVNKGNEVVYEGSQLTHAIAAWDSL
jgi:hypothetical protein